MGDNTARFFADQIGLDAPIEDTLRRHYSGPFEMDSFHFNFHEMKSIDYTETVRRLDKHVFARVRNQTDPETAEQLFRIFLSLLDQIGIELCLTIPFQVAERCEIYGLDVAVREFPSSLHLAIRYERNLLVLCLGYFDDNALT